MRLHSNDIATIFDVCLDRIRHGESPEACLVDYPSQAKELEPLLIAAQRARTQRPPALDPQARLAIQRRMHQAIADRQRARRPTIASWFRPAIVRFALALVIALVSMTGVAAAQTSLPGSLLYPVKRAGEGIRLVLGFTPAQRAALHLDFAAARAAEIRALADGQQVIDGSLVADLEREYSLAREEFGRAPSADANNLAIRYVSERQSDVAMLSDLLARGNTLGRPQIESALRLSQQALTGIEPPKEPVHSGPTAPASQPAPDHDAGVGTSPETKPNHGGQTTPPGSGDAQSGSGPHSGSGQAGENQSGPGNSAAPQPTPSGKPADAGSGKPADMPGQGNNKPEDSGSSKPADTPGQDTSKPADTGSGKPADTPAQENNTPADAGSGKPADTPGQENNKPADSSSSQSTDSSTGQDNKPADAGSGQPPDTPAQDTGKPADAGSGQPPDTPAQDIGKPAHEGSGQPSDTPPGQDAGKPADVGSDQPSDTPGQDTGKPADAGSGQSSDTQPGQGNGNNGRGGRP